MVNHPHRSTERVTISNMRGHNERVTLPTPIWEGRVETSTGITLEAIYRGQRTGRMFARYYSCWQKRGGNAVGVEGTTYSELDLDEYLQVCRLADIEPVGVSATEV